MHTHHIAIFGSGGGSNAQALMDAFAPEADLRIALVVSNKADAGILARAQRMGVPTLAATGPHSTDGPWLLAQLQAHGITDVLLAGWLKHVPAELIAAYPRMLNIHPALLPAYGGQGMYGMHVHRAVAAAGERRSGITIHQVSAEYDRGAIVFQYAIDLAAGATAEEIQRQVLRQEHAHYPAVAAAWLRAGANSH